MRKRDLRGTQQRSRPNRMLVIRHDNFEYVRESVTHMFATWNSFAYLYLACLEKPGFSPDWFVINQRWKLRKAERMCVSPVPVWDMNTSQKVVCFDKRYIRVCVCMPVSGGSKRYVRTYSEYILWFVLLLLSEWTKAIRVTLWISEAIET